MCRRGPGLPTLLALAVGAGLLGCDSRSAPDSTGAAASTPHDVDPHWPPPYFFHFVGYEVPNGAIQQAFGLAVDDSYAYWYQYDGKYMRLDKREPDAESQLVYPRATGSLFALGLDAGYLY